MLEYWAPHQDPEDKTTEQDFINASTTTLDGLVRAVHNKLAEKAKAEGPFRADTIPGWLYLRDKPAVGGVEILHRVEVPRPAGSGGHRGPKIEQAASYGIFEIPDGLSSSMTLRLEERYELRQGGYLYLSDGSPIKVSPDPAINSDLIARQLAEADKWAEAEQAEFRLGLDFLSEAGAQRLATHIAAARPIG